MNKNLIGKIIIKSMTKFKKFYSFIPDKQYLSLRYYATFGRKLDLKNPKTLNEKLQWLKLYDRNPIYSIMVDKYEMKNYVASKIGDEYIIKTLGVWDRFEEIDFSKLPKKFVLKTTHDSGGVVICNKDSLNIDSIRKKINKSIQNNYFWWGREWPYKDIKPRIIAEEFLVDESGIELKDYKIQCFNGIPVNTLVCKGRNTEEKVEYKYFDMNWNFLRYSIGDEKLPQDFSMKKPKNYKKMIEIAETLSEGFPEARIDMYNIEGKIYVGEITLYSQSGFDLDITYEADIEMGKYLKLI